LLGALLDRKEFFLSRGMRVVEEVSMLLSLSF